MMSPSHNHGYVQARLIAELSQYTNYSIYGETSLWIQEKEYVPDVLVYSKRKFLRPRDILRMTEMPISIFEILSPTQGSEEIIEKFDVFFQAGIQSCWLVIPTIQIITVFYDMTTKETFGQGQVKDSTLNVEIAISAIFD